LEEPGRRHAEGDVRQLGLGVGDHLPSQLGRSHPRHGVEQESQERQVVTEDRAGAVWLRVFIRRIQSISNGQSGDQSSQEAKSKERQHGFPLVKEHRRPSLISK
jgi:hypothetical protein